MIDVFSYDRESLRKTIIDFVKWRSKNECASTYCYHFNPIFRINDGSTALHSSDIAFMFNNISMVPSTYLGKGVAENLQKEMAGRLLAFAKTNVPNIEGSIDWKESDINNVHTMVFAEKCEVKTNFDEKLLNLMEGLKVFGRA